ncbi:MAG: FecR domain-containing protein [Acidobacteria bacterium]|nr:FecR domain-containing protein [Acidobacteriota bacterium]
MKLFGWSVLASFVLAAASIGPAWGADADTHTALPGTLNYVEGQASIGNQVLDSTSVGRVDLGPGETVSTGNGKAEILLTPGVYFRLGNESSAQMIAPELTNTELELNKGEAMVEVDQIHPENDIRIRANGVDTRLVKTGLYDFDADHGQVRVFDGQASVAAGDKDIKVKGGHELDLNAAGRLKSKGFDKKQYAGDNDLYRWSSLRSDYLSEANVNTAEGYGINGWYGAGWFGAGWYWSPWFDTYTFVPSAGYFFNPFGWGFYSPLWVARAPWYDFGAYHHRFQTFRPEPFSRGRAFAGVRPGPAYGPGFRGGAVHSFGRAPMSFGGRVRGFTPPAHAANGFGGFRAGGFHGGFGGRR